MRNYALDGLKLILAIMVVALHCRFLLDADPLAGYLLVNGIFRIAVPIFFIINGYYFLDSVGRNGLWPWAARILALYAFWTVFYAYFWFRPEEGQSATLLVLSTIWSGFYHLWYLPAMVWAGLLLYLARHLSTARLVVVVLLTFVTGVSLNYLANSGLGWFAAHGDNEALLWTYRNVPFFAFPFFCIGYLVRKMQVADNMSLGTILGTLSLGIGTLLLESYMNYQSDTFGQKDFDCLLSLILICPALFVLSLKLKIPGKTAWLAGCASSVYFLHIFFISAYGKIADFDSLTLTAAVCASALLLSIVLIPLGRKFRFIL